MVLCVQPLLRKVWMRFWRIYTLSSRQTARKFGEKTKSASALFCATAGSQVTSLNIKTQQHFLAFRTNNFYTETPLLLQTSCPCAGNQYRNQQHKNGIGSGVGVKRRHDIELPLLLACRSRFNLFHSAVIQLIMLQSKATIPYWWWWHKLLHGFSNWITHYFTQ